MSSPLAKPDRNRFDDALITAHQSLSHSTRIAILADLLVQRIAKRSGDLSSYKCLDIGCGDLKLSALCRTKLAASSWMGVDLYPRPPENSKDFESFVSNAYTQFDGTHLPFDDKHFECGLLVDVLHHVPESQRAILLQEALRVCRYLIVKDHFEYSLWSRQMLRAMDFVGNYGYGVSVPRRYFTPATFESLIAASGGISCSSTTGVRLYDHLFGMKQLLRPEWHFIAEIDAA